jgi:trimethylamine:corrinoid methyltransferase-like protein
LKQDTEAEEYCEQLDPEDVCGEQVTACCTYIDGTESCVWKYNGKEYTSEEELGIDAIGAVSPGGHFFGTDHTMARYETAFYTPLVSDWQNNENWQAAGAKDATERATALWQQAIETFEAPLIDSARCEAMDEYVDRRKTQIGSSDP